jgi:hypothetical protein
MKLQSTHSDLLFDDALNKAKSLYLSGFNNT